MLKKVFKKKGKVKSRLQLIKENKMLAKEIEVMESDVVEEAITTFTVNEFLDDAIDNNTNDIERNPLEYFPASNQTTIVDENGNKHELSDEIMNKLENIKNNQFEYHELIDKLRDDYIF